MRDWAEANKGNRASHILGELAVGDASSEDAPAELRDITSHIHELRRKAAEGAVDAYPLLAWCATNLSCPAGPVSRFVETALLMKQHRDAGVDYWATRFDGQFSRYRNHPGPRSFDDAGVPVKDVPTAVAMEVADHIEKWASEVADNGQDLPFAPQTIVEGEKPRPPDGEWVGPMTKAEIARRVFGNPSARWRKAAPLFDDAHIQQVTARTFHFRIDFLREPARTRCRA